MNIVKEQKSGRHEQKGGKVQPRALEGTECRMCERATRLRPWCQHTPQKLPLCCPRPPNPSAQLGVGGLRGVHLHSPKAERRSFTNQNPLSGCPRHPESGTTFRGLHGLVECMPANPSPTALSGIQSEQILLWMEEVM